MSSAPASAFRNQPPAIQAALRRRWGSSVSARCNKLCMEIKKLVASDMSLATSRKARLKIQFFNAENTARRVACQLRAQRSGSRLEAKKKHVRRMKKALRLFHRLMAFSELEGEVKIDVFSFEPVTINTTQPAFWPAALLRRASVLPQAKPRRRRNSLPPSIEIPKGGAGQRSAKPKKKDTLLACLSFWCRWPDSNRHGVATGGF